VRQNGTIERKHPCLLERGSRNYYLLLFSSTLSCLVSHSLPSLLLLASREIYRLLLSLRILSIFHSLSLSFFRSLTFLSFLPSTRSSQCTCDVTSTRISYRKKKPKKAREHGLFLPILIRLPHLGTSVHPRFSVLLVPAKIKKSVSFQL